MDCRITHIPVTTHRIMPWKNGGGSTTEIWIDPPYSNVNEAFLWRISLAQIKTSGPFSSFPGFDRTIVQLSGAPMHLYHQRLSQHTLTPFTPYSFQGEWATECSLDGDKAEDFNVMVQREKIRAQVSCHHLSSQYSMDGSALLFIWLWRGFCNLEIGNQNSCLGPGEGLLVEQAQGRKLFMTGDSAKLIVVNLDLLADPGNIGL